MPALYAASVPEFLTHDEDLIVGRQTAITQQGFAELSAEQLSAWRQEVPILRNALRSALAQSWYLLLEYPIPRRGKRIDAVILTNSTILVVEFKCGAKTYDRDACRQVEDYCLDLRDFHAGSRQHILVPVVVATGAQEVPLPSGNVFDWIAPVWKANAHCLGRILEQAAAQYPVGDSIRPHSWNTAQYSPTPTIIEAARVLYEGQNVREISRCHAGAENLTKTSDAVMRAISEARDHGQKTICFVTGVPGAGKTLAGLNIVHNRELHEGSLGVFLSGNGPLVRVLSEALARDHSDRTKISTAESRRKVKTFIQNVHQFIDAHYRQSDAPHDRVIVFDEAQRAWNAEHSNRKFKRPESEPEIMLEIMSRHSGWAVIVALIGGGQEINTGEAGLKEWGRALSGRFKQWNVAISPRLALDAGSNDGDALFDAMPSGVKLFEEAALHLDVSLRSYKAEAVSEFVSHLLSMHIEEARSTLASCQDFPIVLTRELVTARDWLRSRQRGFRRSGLIAPSGGRRLKALGLDVRAELDVESWFLNSIEDVRSSYYLETPATEFGIQGLELDWIGLCWDIDLVPRKGVWNVRAFKGTKWQAVRDSSRRQFVLNKYRVLLTRAREGMVICVPRGDLSDWTRPPVEYDSIADYLRSCGVKEM